MARPLSQGLQQGAMPGFAPPPGSRPPPSSFGAPPPGLCQPLNKSLDTPQPLHSADNEIMHAAGSFQPPRAPMFGGTSAAPLPSMSGATLAGPALQRALEPFESVALGPTAPGTGQAMGMDLDSLPRPVGREMEEALAASPPPFPLNCPSRYMRLTVGAIPAQQSQRARYQLPIGAVVQPLADPQNVPLVPPSGPAIIRCRRCRTYINPFVTWVDGGRCVLLNSLVCSDQMFFGMGC